MVSQLNFESDPIVIFVIVKHMCLQLENLLHILQDRFWQKIIQGVSETFSRALCSKNVSSIFFASDSIL